MLVTHQAFFEKIPQATFEDEVYDRLRGHMRWWAHHSNYELAASSICDLMSNITAAIAAEHFDSTRIEFHRLPRAVTAVKGFDIHLLSAIADPDVPPEDHLIVDGSYLQFIDPALHEGMENVYVGSRLEVCRLMAERALDPVCATFYELNSLVKDRLV